jgi:hypothetical protein
MRSTRATLLTLALCAACAQGGSGPLGTGTAGGAAGAAGAGGGNTTTGTPRVSPSRITSATGFKALPGNVSPRLKRATDLGRTDPTRRLEGMSIVFSPSGNKADREGLLAAQQNPGSPWYHGWLTPEDYAARFGASPGDVARLSQWLVSQGFEVIGPNRMATSLTFTGTVGQLEQAFQTEMHDWDVHGEHHFALAVEPSVPAAFADLAAGLRNVHDFRPSPPSHTIDPLPQPDYKTGQGKYWIDPNDFATIYDVAPLYALAPPIDGTGMKVGIAGQSEILDSDVLTFRAAFGLSATTPQRTLVPNSGSPWVPDPNNQAESSLDIEWSGGIAKNASVEFVYTGNNQNYNVYDAAYYAIDQAIAPLVSFSFGGCEAQYGVVEAAYQSTLGDAASMTGITFIAATGDAAAAGCDEYAALATDGLSISLPASMPGAVGVGGTVLLPLPVSMYWGSSGEALSYFPESGWNDTIAYHQILGGGGGASIIFPKPYWQVGVTPNDGARDLPDISLSASSAAVPYYVEIGGAPAGYGGTSCSAPSFAGILTLVEQAIAVANPMAPVGLGNANPVLYALANNPATKDAFHDITMGSNIVPCQQGTPDCPSTPPFQFGYAAGPGYDEVTGNGSIDAAKLAQAWSAALPTGTTLAATPVAADDSITLTATVSSTGTTTPLTGDVIFYYETLTSSNQIDVAAPLGAVALVSTSGAGGTAQLATHAPAGFTGTSTLVAFYAGDVHYLASWSPGQSVTAAASTLAVVPSTATVPVCGTVQLTTAGGAPPVQWSLQGSYGWGFIDLNTGLYHAGNMGGVQDTVFAMDSNGTQAEGTVITTTMVVDGGCPTDAGAESGEDTGVTVDSSAPVDASSADAGGRRDSGSGTMGDGATGDGAGFGDSGSAGESGSHSGCSCNDVGGSAGAEGFGGGAAVAGIVVLGARRRRRFRSASAGRHSRL